MKMISCIFIITCICLSVLFVYLSKLFAYTTQQKLFISNKQGFMRVLVNTNNYKVGTNTYIPTLLHQYMQKGMQERWEEGGHIHVG